MRYIKLFFKCLFILLIPYVFQITVTIAYSISQTVKLMASGIDESMLSQVLMDLVLKNTLYLLAISAVLYTSVFLITSLAKGKSLKTDYSLHKLEFKHLLLVVLLSFTGFLLAMGINGSLDVASLDPNGAEAVSSLVMSQSMPLTLLIVGLLIPFAEEIVFRGALTRNLRRNMPVVWAIVIQAAIFGLYHMNIVQGIAAFFLGLNIGFAVYFTRSLWAGIAIHIINNSLSIILSRSLPGDFNITRPIYFLILALGLLLTLLVQKSLYQQRLVSKEEDTSTSQVLLEV